jgi:hypothetical protein
LRLGTFGAHGVSTFPASIRAAQGRLRDDIG